MWCRGGGWAVAWFGDWREEPGPRVTRVTCEPDPCTQSRPAQLHHLCSTGRRAASRTKLQKPHPLVCLVWVVIIANERQRPTPKIQEQPPGEAPKPHSTGRYRSLAPRSESHRGEEAICLVALSRPKPVMSVVSGSFILSFD